MGTDQQHDGSHTDPNPVDLPSHPVDPVNSPLPRLRAWFREYDSALVAFSGGVDSALVMAVAHEQLSHRALACIGVSPSYPAREMRQAVALAEQLGAAYRLVDTEEHLDTHYAANAPDRCYHCKNELYGRLHAIADRDGWHVIADGTNRSDLDDTRPGIAAADRHAVRRPLAELGLTKDQVRAAAQELGLPVWDKPAMACLSSRVPHGTPITPQLLRQIESAEDVLFEHGFSQFRVRHHGEVARIELGVDDLPRAVAQRSVLVDRIRAAGYRHVCLDLAGFRGGADDTAPARPVGLTVKGRP